MIATYLACLRVLVPQESMMFISIFGNFETSPDFDNHDPRVPQFNPLK